MSHILDSLAKTIAEKAAQPPETSYSAQLLHDGLERILRKFGEESLEVVLAASVSEDPKAEVISESADLLYHLLVLWQHEGISAKEVWKELANRQGQSGLDEKASR